jgi:hypothetical protein
MHAPNVSGIKRKEYWKKTNEKRQFFNVGNVGDIVIRNGSHKLRYIMAGFLVAGLFVNIRRKKNEKGFCTLVYCGTRGICLHRMLSA